MDRTESTREVGSYALGRVCRIIGVLALVLMRLSGEYRKEPPVALIVAPDGGTYVPAGTKTPLTLQPGVFLFAGDTVSASGKTVRLLWCPDGADRKFEYTISGNTSLILNTTVPALPGGKELDLCLLPELERNPEVATLPALSQLLPPPLPTAKVEEDLGNIPPDTASALRDISQKDLTDPRIRLAYAVSLAAAGLGNEAIDQYSELIKLWPDQPRLGRLILDLRQTSETREVVHPKEPTASPPAAATKGKTYALVIGIRKYAAQNLKDLLFSDADARDFANFLKTPRGGKAEVVQLVNEQARASEIRNHLTDLLTKLKKDDKLVLFIAAHGDMQGNMPIVVTYRADPQDTGINGLPLSEIQKLRFGEKKDPFQVWAFLDICHAGNIALLDPPAPKGQLPKPAPEPRNFLCLTATHQGPDALAYEDSTFGHGVFTYFLLRGLATPEASVPGDHVVTAVSLKSYVENSVQTVTTGTDRKPRQSPTAILGVPLGYEVADLDLDGPKFNDPRPLSKLVLPPEKLASLRKRGAPQKKEPEQSSIEEAARAVPSDLSSRISLEDAGEEVLLRYLEGDEVPQQREDFARGESVYTQALALQPGSPYLEARKVFCEGRVSVFDKRYDAAIPQLERSIRLDPVAAYAYNALGIAYLEKGDYTMARLAFEDAIQRAPKWAYPRHNLALVHTQAGDYERAIATYQEAMVLAPDYSYLPYNLGLLYQRLNRRDEAEAEYRLAIQKAAAKPPGRSEPYIALGLLEASQSRWEDAEINYRKALTIPSGELSLRTARHNLAVLLARKKRRRAEAETLWRQNGDYVPSQLAYAEALTAWKRPKDAIRQYREILCEMPDHLSARLQLAAELEKSGDHKAAVSELRTARSQQPENPLILERLAENLEATGGRSEALEVYRAALDYGVKGTAQSRMRKAVKRLEQSQ